MLEILVNEKKKRKKKKKKKQYLTSNIKKIRTEKNTQVLQKNKHAGLKH